MPTEALNEFLETSGISAPNREYIEASADRNLAFGRVESRRGQNKAQDAIWIARDTMRKQSVFIPSEIEQKFEEAFNVLHKVWAEQHVNLASRGSLPLDASINLIGKAGEVMRSTLRDVVRKRVLRDATGPSS